MLKRAKAYPAFNNGSLSRIARTLPPLRIQDFVERHASIVDGASVVIADGNLPPEGFARAARLCAERNVPLVFEPTSVAKCSVPFSAEVNRTQQWRCSA